MQPPIGRGRSDFRSRFPQVKLRKERVLVPAGEGHRIITAGSTTSWHDLLLYLIARVHSLEEARRIAKFFLLQWHADGQLPFASLTVTRQHKDPLIARRAALGSRQLCKH